MEDSRSDWFTSRAEEVRRSCGAAKHACRVAREAEDDAEEEEGESNEVRCA